MFIFCQQHAREWVTAITCLETAERLVRNYATDPTTKAYVDNLDIFILPSSTRTAAHYSMYDFKRAAQDPGQLLPGDGHDRMPSGRNAWGVDLNRNNTRDTLFDGYFGASTACTSDVYAGPFEASEPEIRTSSGSRTRSRSIKFANNIHTPRRLLHVGAGRLPADGPHHAAGPEHRHREVLLRRAGRRSCRTSRSPRHGDPAAAHGPDRRRAVLGGRQLGRRPVLPQGHHRLLVRDRAQTDSSPTSGRHPSRSRPASSRASRASAPAAGTLRQLQREPRSTRVATRRWSSPPATTAWSSPRTTTRWTPPRRTRRSSSTRPAPAGAPINYRFNLVGEPSVIHYTTDGSTPTLNSPTYNNQRARSIGEVLTINRLGVHDIKWFAVDIKGNQSAVETQRFLIGPRARTWAAPCPRPCPCRSARRRRSGPSRPASRGTTRRRRRRT